MRHGQNRAPPQTKSAVLLVDDHPLLLKGLSAMINQEPDMRVCGGVGEAHQALEAAQGLSPDVVVIDISLPNGSGIDLIRILKARYKNLPSLVFSLHDEMFFAERALRAGAVGYVMKDAASEMLVSAIRRILGGEFFLSDRMKARLLNQFVRGKFKPGVSSIDNLSHRELEVFRLIGEGQGTCQIANDLRLSMRVVEACRQGIKGKLHLENSTAVIQHAYEYVRGGEASRDPKGEIILNGRGRKPPH